MKRDIELVKKILQYFEKKENWKHEDNIEIAGYDSKLISYHIQIMYEAGLINGEPVKSEKGRIYDVLPFRLTWEGHEFLDAVKDDSRWSKLMAIIKDKGINLAFDTIKFFLFELSKDQLMN